MMKQAIFITVIMVILSSGLSAQAEKEVKAELKQVTVYPDRAQLIHEGAVSVQQGKSILTLPSLSPYIDPQSVQVKGTGDFTILSVNHRNNYLQNLDDIPEIKALRSQVEGLQIKVEDEKAAIGILKEKREFLTANKAVLVKETTFSIDQLKNLMDLYTKSMEQVTTGTLSRERLIKDYEKQIAKLQKELADKSARQLPSSEIDVTVVADRAVSGKLIFSYVVSNAGWYPSYDIRVDDIKKPVTIFYKANVFQNTGNAWKDIKISFSNATPWVAGDIPVLYPWFVDFYYPVQAALTGTAAGIFRTRAALKKSEDTVLYAMAEEAAEAPAPVVEKRVGETTVTFDVSAPVTIPADGTMQTVELQRLTADAEYRYVSAPKLSQLAYLSANITDWARLNLQSGEANLYFENTFVGKSNINVSQVTDTLALSLGTDNGLVVKREKRSDFTSRKTIGANKTETFSFLISVRNNKQVPVRITLRDQLPVSSNSSIDVEPSELSGGKLNQGTGEIRWDLEIGSQETKKLILTYSVKYPKDKTVILE